ncbi:MAG: hypothetical protein IJ608_05655 [Lachnospiraceae bacterium]|nr:hypothetical protein [Lachnospiraceae bacterium]
MITYDKSEMAMRDKPFSFKGKSTDTKPTGSYDGIEILNGSSFLEIDTKAIFFYDKENESWT